MSNEKLDRIITLLEDENVGLCGRVKKLESTINGNGKVGLAEAVRTNSRNWAIVVFIITIGTPLVFKYWVNK